MVFTTGAVKIFPFSKSSFDMFQSSLTVIGSWGVSQRCVVSSWCMIGSSVWGGIWSISAISWDDWSNCAGSGNEC